MNHLLYKPSLKAKAGRLDDQISREYLADGKYIDIRIITLKSYYIDQIYESAFNMAGGDVHRVSNIAHTLMESGGVKVREFVEVEKEQIVVVINVDKIDQKAEDNALALLVEVEEIKVGVKQEFGDPITFNYNEVT